MGGGYISGKESLGLQGVNSFEREREGEQELLIRRGEVQMGVCNFTVLVI